jgi:hypothetical protein
VGLAGQKFLRAAAMAALAVAAICEIASLRVSELGPRLSALAGFSRLSAQRARLGGSALAFDRSFGLFLEGVRRATPPGAVIALAAPGNNKLYAYVSAYVLAPRSVVPPGRLGEADFAAAYGRTSVPGAPSPAPIPFGALGRLR